MAFRLTLHPAGTSSTSDPMSLVFEQQRVTIGRAETNDIVVLDPKVSKEHAVIELAATGHHVVRDRHSKNATFVEDERVAPPTPTLLVPDATIHVGDTALVYMPLVPVTADPTDGALQEDHRETSAVAPKQIDAVADLLVACLERIADVWRREDEIAGEQAETVVKQRIRGAEQVHDVVHHLTAMLQPGPSPYVRDAETEKEKEESWGALPSILRDVLALPEVIWEQLDEELEAQANPFLAVPATEEIQQALLMRDASDSDDASYMQLCMALQYVVLHHHAVLHGYRASIEAGGQALLRRISPRDSVPDPGKTGVFTRVFGGNGSNVGWDRLERQWRKLYHSDWGAIEQVLFRPSLLKTYQEYVENPPDAYRSALPKENTKPLDKKTPA